MSDTQGWIQYEIQRGLSERWRASWDLGYRELLSTEEELGDWSRLHSRGIVTYVHSQRLAFEAAVAGYYTFSGSFTDVFELRTWQGAFIFWPKVRLAGRVLVGQHRFRLEQRWIDLRDSCDSDFGFRFRYRLATFVPLNRPTVEVKSWYVPLMVEAFGDPGDDSPSFFAERLRLTAGVGYVLSDNWTLEGRYVAQKSRDTVLDRFTITDHIFDLRIRTALRIRDLLPSLR